VFRLYRLKAYAKINAAIPAIPHSIPIPILAPVPRPDDEVAFEVGSAVPYVELNEELVGVDVAAERTGVVVRREEVEEAETTEGVVERSA
jgi:hypothetical protein